MRKITTRKIGNIAITILLVSGMLYVFMPPVQAGALSARKDTLQDSRHAQLSRQTFVFTTATALTTDSGAGADFSVVVNFPVNAGGDPYGTSVPDFVAANMGFSCTGGDCGSHTFTVIDVEESSNGGSGANDEFLVAVSSNITGDLDLGAIVTLTFGASSGAQRLTNPADDAAGCTAGATSGDADICRITVATSETITGASPTAVDSGDVLVAHIAGVTVSVTVAETLAFSLADVSVANCDTSFGNIGDSADADGNVLTIAYGALASSDTFYHDCHDVSFSTNASGTTTVTVQESDQLTSGGNQIPDTTCDGGSCSETTQDDWATATGNDGFGHSCVNTAGTPCNTVYTDVGGACGTPPCYRQFADVGDTETAQTLMSISGPTSTVTGRLEYKLSIDPIQAAGGYSNTITYIATPPF